jgi:transcriptional regulator
MYVPGHFREQNQEKIDAFVRHHDFATLVSWDGARPVASHLLLELERRHDGTARLNGHMSRANPQWQSFDREQEVLAIFSGAHTYVSAGWYGHVNVPTWNYLAVHVSGVPRLVTDRDRLVAMLKRLVDRHEAEGGSTPPYRMEALPRDYLDKELKGIAGFEIEVARMEVSFKLSQNRNRQDHDAVVAALEKRGDENSVAIARAMRATGPARRTGD